MIFQRLWAGLLGFGFLVVGILRFIRLPTILDLSVAQPLHGALHLVSGAILVGTALAERGKHAEVMNRWNGIFWGVLGVLGLPGVVLFSDNATHLFVGIASAAMGWVSPWSSVWRRRSLRFRRVTGGLLTGLLAVGFVGAGGMKLLGRQSMVAEFAQIGVGQWLRVATGGTELVAAVALFVPVARTRAAELLAVIAVGAIGTNLLMLGRPAIVPALLLVLALVVVGLHRTPEVTSSASERGGRDGRTGRQARPRNGPRRAGYG